MTVTPQQMAELTALCRPLSKWLKTNAHPHTMVQINWQRFDLLEGVCGAPFIIQVLDAPIIFAPSDS